MRLKTTADKVDFLNQDEVTRRKMIAQDVINSIKAERILAKTGAYLMVGDSDEMLVNCGDWSDTYEATEYDVCMALLDTQKVCVCCARGALLASRIGYQHPVDTDCKDDPLFKYNRPDVKMNNDEMTQEGVKDEFTSSQVSLIENAFEVNRSMNSLSNSHADREAAAMFGEQFLSSASRLTAIMQAIIDDPNGEFNPPLV